MDPAATTAESANRSERAFEAQMHFVDELEVSMLLQSHQDAVEEAMSNEKKKQASSKLKAKHGK